MLIALITNHIINLRLASRSEMPLLGTARALHPGRIPYLVHFALHLLHQHIFPITPLLLNLRHLLKLVSTAGTLQKTSASTSAATTTEESPATTSHRTSPSAVDDAR
jgi:hypothetical protein